MNIHDTEIMKGLLVNSGHEIVDNVKLADLIVINTCAVREKSENKVYSLVGRLKKDGYKIGITGCVAQIMQNKLKNYGVDFVIGTRAISSISSAVSGVKKIDLEDHICEVNSDTPVIREQKRHAWVNVIAGCNKFCTYCIVPYTRGRELSRPIEDIISEVKNLSLQGYNQITFLGQNVDSYGKDMKDGSSLAKLLELSQKTDGIKRVWFLTSYPSDITDELIDTVNKYSKIAKNFHIPAQSGSNRILKKMNRRYTHEEYSELVDKIRKRVELATIGGDIIVGFPGETDEDFEQTLSLVENTKYIKLNVAPYSTRPGTVASKYYPDDVPYAVKKMRIAKLKEIQNEIENDLNEKLVGSEVEVIVESGNIHSYARTIDNRMVFIEEKVPEGETVKVHITAFRAGTLYGRIKKVSVFAK